MIHLFPNKTYKITYIEGRLHHAGDTLVFQTTDTVPEAKHLIKVKNTETGEIVNLIELLAHPWESLIEDVAATTKTITKKGSELLQAFIPFFLMTLREPSTIPLILSEFA